MSLILNPYEIAIVGNDLTPSETLKDVIFALECLSKTVDSIFDRLEHKILLEKDRLNGINQKLTACTEKVNSLRGSKKAITVFSTAKFPAPKVTFSLIA